MTWLVFWSQHSVQALLPLQSLPPLCPDLVLLALFQRSLWNLTTSWTVSSWSLSHFGHSPCDFRTVCPEMFCVNECSDGTCAGVWGMDATSSGRWIVSAWVLGTCLLFFSLCYSSLFFCHTYLLPTFAKIRRFMRKSVKKSKRRRCWTQGPWRKSLFFQIHSDNFRYRAGRGGAVICTGEKQDTVLAVWSFAALGCSSAQSKSTCIDQAAHRKGFPNITNSCDSK